MVKKMMTIYLLASIDVDYQHCVRRLLWFRVRFDVIYSFLCSVLCSTSNSMANPVFRRILYLPHNQNLTHG